MREHLPFTTTILVCVALTVALHRTHPVRTPRNDKAVLLGAAISTESAQALEAFERLLELQPEWPTLELAMDCDHPYVVVEEESTERIVLVGTQKALADRGRAAPRYWQRKHPEDGQDYWAVGRFEFDPEGRLISWAAIRR